MVWNSLFEQWSATWGAFGAVGLLSLKTFILDPLRNRKAQFDLTSFKSLQTSVKDEIKAYTKIMVDGFEEFKRQAITPLVETVQKQSLQQEIANSVIITLMANMNVPLAKKELAFEELSKIESMNKELLSKIQQGLEIERKMLDEKQTAIKKTTSQLDEV